MKNNKTMFSYLWKYAGRYKKYLLAVFVCGISGNALLLLGPILTGEAIDRMAGKGAVDFRGLGNILLILIALYLFGSLFQWLMAIAGSVAANRTIHDLRSDAFARLNTLPLKYFDNTPHGDVISRLTNDLDAVSEGLFQGITQVMSAAVIIAGCFLFMLSISPMITLLVVLVTPLCFFIAAFITKHSKRMFAEQSRTVGELNSLVEEMVGSQKTVRAFGHEKAALEQFKEINGRLYHCGQKAQWYSSLTNPTTRLVNNIAYVGVAVLGGTMAVSGHLSVGKIASFLTYSTQFAKPINEITAITAQIQSALASAKRVFALLEEEPEVPVRGKGKLLRNCRGNIEFRQVAFSYRPSQPLINKLNLIVREGERVAIVGPTGSGKTTLVNLLMRFYDVDAGQIRVDGTDIYEIKRESLRSSIGMVLQESWLFSGTIAENIAYGKGTASREEIIAAAKEANAHGFIKRMPEGYDTRLDEEGSNLSQGQKQLLTIARVMLIDPPVLILDEATSSIDTRTELTVQKAFAKIMEGRTSFVIAHRLSTIQEADTILVLKDGNIIEQGRHEDLLSKKGFYYALYDSQFSS